MQDFFGNAFYLTNFIVGGDIKQTSGIKCPSSGLGKKKVQPKLRYQLEQLTFL